MSFAEKLGIPEHEFRVVIGSTQIDYDLNKEDENRGKHKYSLESAVHLLERALLTFGSQVPYLVSDGFLHEGEVRHMHMTPDDSGAVVFMVTTMRPDETVRIISIRRASEAEREEFRRETGYVEPSNAR